MINMSRILPTKKEVLDSSVFRNDVSRMLEEQYPHPYYIIDYEWRQSDYQELVLDIEVYSRAEHEKLGAFKFVFALNDEGKVESC